MEPTQSELAARFAAMSDADLQALVAQRDQLTDEAHDLLLAKFTGRNIVPVAITREEQEPLPASQVWVTVENFRDLSEGIVARTALESAGIPCFLRDENTVRIDWQISNFIGGMRLQVLEPDVAESRQVLAGLGAEQAEFVKRCPRCYGTRLSRDDRRRSLAFAALWLFSIPVPQGKAEMRCEDCGMRFPDEPESTQGRS